MLDRGMSLAAAASIMSATTASAIAGKLLIAWIADRSDLRILLGVTALFGIILCGTLLTDPPYAAILAVSLLTGLAIGGTYPLASALMAQRFGAASVGTAIGLKMPLVSVAATTLLYFVGHTHDRTGSYNFAFAVFAGIVLVAVCFMPLIRRWRNGALA
jgi:cyanate permease